MNLPLKIVLSFFLTMIVLQSCLYIYYDESNKLNYSSFVSPQNYLISNKVSFFELADIKADNISVPSFEVHGVLNSSINQSVIVVSSTDSPKKRIIGLNEEIFPNTVLVEINQDYIVVEKNGAKQKVEVAQARNRSMNGFAPNFQSYQDQLSSSKEDQKNRGNQPSYQPGNQPSYQPGNQLANRPTD